MAATEEAETVIISAIQKLSRWRVGMPLYLNTLEKSDIEAINERMEGVISDLRMILDFLRNNKVGEWSSSSSKSRRLKDLICEVLQMSHDVIFIYQTVEINLFFYEIDPLLGWLGEVKSRLFKLGSDGKDEEEEEEEPSKRILKNINVGEGDEGQYVVGLEKHVQSLLRDQIFDDDEYDSAFTIKGIVGSGKTTLSRLLYNHKDVVDKFECRAWVCVSTNLTYKQVLVKLVQQLVDSEELQRGALLEKVERADNTSLQEMLHQHLQGKRYFIVIDDIRHQMRLESIINFLPREDKGSRVLLTMRCHIQEFDIGSIHKMSYLNSDESWKLFFKTISCNNELTSEQKFPKHLHRRGKSMLRKCGGLPLAIKLVGRQSIERRQSGTEWEEIIESFDLGPVVKLLEPIYQRLDPTMKSCFLHFSFFKENASIKEHKLIQTLHAGSEVLKRKRVQECLKELRDRESIIESKYLKAWRKDRSWRINSLFHALSIKKAEEEIDLEILSNNGNYRLSPNPRHRVVSSYTRDKFNYSTNQDHGHIVSLFFHGGGYFDDNSSYWETLEQLRILDLDDYGIKVLPEAIGTRKKLRYLGLRNNYLQVLPYSFRCLKKLEVIDIAQNYMMEVPDIIWKMCSLRHIYMSDIICQKPLKIDELKNLRSFTYISVDNWAYDLSELEMMTELKKLGIEELDVNSDVSKLFTSLSMLSGLKTLIIRGFRFKSMPCLDDIWVLSQLTTLKLGGLLLRLPSFDNFPPSIKYLKLYDSCLGDDPMPILERLPKLRSLKLRNAYTGKEMVISCDGFSNLNFMYIEELWNLRNVHVGNGDDPMPELRRFKINNCPYLKTVPKDIPLFVKDKVVIKV